MQKKLDAFLESCKEDLVTSPTPASLRSRIYSAVVQEAEKNAPLRPLSASVQAGYAICDWENLTRHLPQGEVRNHCRICHARIVAENFDNISMPWFGCPYHRLHSK